MPRDRRSCWIALRFHAASLACALISACSKPPERNDRRIVVVPAKSAPSQPTRPTSAAVAPRAIATPSPTPARPRQAFVDPPLPAELIDPPGLLPLPPRPTFTDNQ